MHRFALILTLWLTVAGCQQKAPPEAGSLLPVRLAYTTQHDCSLVHVAQAKGFFREEGVAVDPQVLSFGKQALDKVLQGKADLATVAETPFVFAALSREKVSLVASIFSSGGNHAIVALDVPEPGGLRGKRIGVIPGTTSDIFLDAFLVANNIDPRQVSAVPMKPDQMPEALTSGKVEAVSIWNPPLKTITKELGKGCNVFSDPHIYTETFVLAGRTDFINENQPLVRRVLRALIKAEEFTRQHPDQARKLVAASLDLDPDLLRELWDARSFSVRLDHSLVISLEEESRWAMKYRAVGKVQMPNYLEHVDPRPLSAVQPSAVSFK